MIRWMITSPTWIPTIFISGALLGLFLLGGLWTEKMENQKRQAFIDACFARNGKLTTYRGGWIEYACEERR